MPRQNQALQRARQRDEDVHPPHQPALLPRLMAFIREKGAVLHAIPLRGIFFEVLDHTFAKIIIYAIATCLGLFCMLWCFVEIEMWRIMRPYKGICTSDWILDTSAPFHTTNQLCAFADKSVQNFSAPVMYKGVEAYSYGTVNLEFPFAHYRDASLVLHYTQYVPERANTISVSQLMQDYTVKFEMRPRRGLGLRFDNTTYGPLVDAHTHFGQYYVEARVPHKRCRCPDLKERSIFKSQTEGALSWEMRYRRCLGQEECGQLTRRQEIFYFD